MPNRIADARQFAVAAHGSQTYGFEPYSVHLDAVAASASPFGEDAQVCAYLNDVVEDTNVSIDSIRDRFGEQMAQYVSLLTDESGVNRKERKARTNAKLKAVPAELNLALIVKAADRLSNLQASAKSADQSKLEMYRKEHAAFSDAVYRAGLCDALWQAMDRILAPATK